MVHLHKSIRQLWILILQFFNVCTFASKTLQSTFWYVISTLLTCDLLVYTCTVIMGLVLVFANHNVAQCVVISGVSIAQYRTCWNAVGVLEYSKYCSWACLLNCSYAAN